MWNVGTVCNFSWGSGWRHGAMFLVFCLFFPDRALELAKGVLTIATLAAFLFAAATVQLVAAGAYWMTYWFFPLVCYTDGQVVPCEAPYSPKK